MSILSDSKILSKIYSKDFEISPIQVENIQPASVDLTLDEDIEVPEGDIRITPPYPTKDEIRKYFRSSKITPDRVLRPGQFIIGQIRETIKLSDRLVGNIQNRNSLIRLGINIGLSTFINPGYKGKLPIAIQNIGSFDVTLTPGMRICQLVLFDTSGVLNDYSKKEDSKYHAEKMITLSKLSEDREFVEYVKKYGNDKSANKIFDFIKESVQAKTTDFFEQLSTEQKQAIGLA